jgi:general secretion pathway protein G
MILRHQPRPEQAERRSAFTLLEVLIVVAIIVILASIGGTYAFRAYEDAKVSEAKIKANAIAGAAQRFQVKYDRPPESLDELVSPPSGGIPFIEAEFLTDPWGGRFQYDPAGPRNNGLKPDVYTTSKHGELIGNFKQ